MEQKPPKCSLAEFVSTKREKLGFSQSGLAKRCSLLLIDIENIEGGLELFLSSTIRQKLAKGLKITPQEIKPYEAVQDFDLVPQYKIDAIKDDILDGEPNIACPLCDQYLITRVAKMYDLEDNLQYHPKARCPKCPFQVV